MPRHSKDNAPMGVFQSLKPQFSRVPGVDIHTNRGMGHMRTWNRTTTRQLDVVAKGDAPNAVLTSYNMLERKKPEATDAHTKAEKAMTGAFDMTPPYSVLGAKFPKEVPHKAHHHYYGWGNTMDNKSEPDGVTHRSRDAFNTYGNAQSYCDKIHNKATSINSKMP